MSLSPDILSPIPPLATKPAPPDPILSPQAGTGEELPAAGVQGAVSGAEGGHRVPGGRSCLTLPVLSHAAGPPISLSGKAGRWPAAGLALLRRGDELVRAG